MTCSKVRTDPCHVVGHSAYFLAGFSILQMHRAWTLPVHCYSGVSNQCRSAGNLSLPSNKCKRGFTQVKCGEGDRPAGGGVGGVEAGHGSCLSTRGMMVVDRSQLRTHTCWPLACLPSGDMVSVYIHSPLHIRTHKILKIYIGIK